MNECTVASHSPVTLLGIYFLEDIHPLGTIDYSSPVKVEKEFDKSVTTSMAVFAVEIKIPQDDLSMIHILFHHYIPIHEASKCISQDFHGTKLRRILASTKSDKGLLFSGHPFESEKVLQ